MKRRASDSDSEHPNKRISVSNADLGKIRETIVNLEKDNTPDEVICRSTTILDDLDETRYTVLAVRAAAFRKHARLSDATEDALEMVRIKPTSAHGYLLASDLYIDQGKQRAAIRILDEGLGLIPLSDQQQLIEKRDLASQLSMIKLDFVATMPREVTTRIFEWVSYYDDDALFNSTRISRQWRSSILSISSLWRRASKTDTPNASFRLLPLISKHLKVLEIESLTSHLNLKLTTLAEASMLPSLTTLSIEYLKNDSTQENDYLYLICCLRNGLVDLTIDAQKCFSPTLNIRLDIILSMCANLKRLVLLAPESSIHYDVAQHPHPNSLQLEMLFLQAANENSITESLLSRCPRLRVLTMALPKGPAALQTLHQHCGHLQELYLNYENSSYADAFPTLNENGYREDTAGLKQLTYQTEGEGSPNLHDLVPLLAKSKDTLERLVLLLESNDDRAMKPTHWFSLTDGRYSQLKIVDINWCDETEGRIGQGVSQILRKSPELESLRITVDPIVQVPDTFFSSLTESSKLSSLAIYFLSASLGGLNQLFNHHAASTPTTLTTISLFQCSALTDASICALASISSLEHITIIGPLPPITSAGVKSFLLNLGRLENLVSLTLVEMNYLDDPSVQKLEEESGLERTMFSKRVEVNGSGESYFCSSLRLRWPGY